MSARPSRLQVSANPAQSTITSVLIAPAALVACQSAIEETSDSAGSECRHTPVRVDQADALSSALLGVDERISDGFFNCTHQVARGSRVAELLLSRHEVEKYLWIDAAFLYRQTIPFDHALNLQCGHASDVEICQRTEHEYAIDPVKDFRGETCRPQCGIGLAPQIVGIVRVIPADRRQRIDGRIGRENKNRTRGRDMAFIRRFGDEAIIPGGQKILVNVRMRLFEFVQQNDRIRRVAQGAGQFAIGIRSYVAFWRTKQRSRGVAAARILRHIKMDQLAVQRPRKHLAEIGFSCARRSCKKENAQRLAALLQCESSANLRGKVVANCVLSNHLRFQRLRQRFSVDENRLGLRLQSLFKFATIGQPVKNVHEPCPPRQKLWYSSSCPQPAKNHKRHRYGSCRCQRPLYHLRVLGQPSGYWNLRQPLPKIDEQLH